LDYKFHITLIEAVSYRIFFQGRMSATVELTVAVCNLFKHLSHLMQQGFSAIHIHTYTSCALYVKYMCFEKVICLISSHA